jgi:hypothetical protein
VVGGPQNRNAFVNSRVAAQLGELTVRTPRKRFFGGPLALPARSVAAPTTLGTQRLLLQSSQVLDELSLGKIVAGPGTIQ